MSKTILTFTLVCLVTYVSAQSKARWYIISFDNNPSGYYLEQNAQSTNEVNTSSVTKIKLSRLGSDVNMEVSISLKEAADGLKSMKGELKFSEQVTTSLANVEASAIQLTTIAGGKESKMSVPYTGTLLSNEGIRSLSLTKLKKTGDSLVYKTFMPDFGMVVQGIRKVVGVEILDINGKSYSTIKVRDTYKELPTKRTSWLDKDFYLVKSTEVSPFGMMMMVIATEKTATAALNTKVNLSEDQYASTVARSNVRLAQPRQLESVTLKITQNKPELGFPDFTSKYQQVLEQTSNYVVIKVNKPKPNEVKETLSANQLEQYKASTSFLNLEDTLIAKTIKKVVGSETDPWKKVLLIRDWTNKNMKFNAGIALAPSSEVIRNMEGTCVSFGTILTTLCRAAGIPARYATGFIYADGMWGGHVWAEVYVNEAWIPVDAVMISPGGVADAGRFHFARFSGNNGLGEYLIGGSQLYSNVKVEILEYQLKGKTIKAKDHPHDVDSKGYVNYGLGIKQVAAPGFKFEDLDLIYPESQLFTMRNERSKESVTVYCHSLAPRADLKKVASGYAKRKNLSGGWTETTLNKKPAIKISSQDKTVLAIENGADIFVFEIEGKKAFDAIRTGFTFDKYPSVLF